MKIISFNDIVSLNISPEQCYEWVNEILLNKDNALLPAKIHMSMEGNSFCNVMPSILNNDTMTGGIKIVTRYPERNPSLDSKIMIFNSDSGEFLALMDGNWITAMRTGAVAAHSVISFAKKDMNVISMIGLGNVARATMLVLASQLSDRPLTVRLLRYKDQAELFVKRFEAYKSITFEIVDTVESVVRNSDVIISCATYFENNIAQDDWFAKGVLVVPVHTRGFTNCDLFFDKVFADDRAHVDHFKNFEKFRSFAEVSDVLLGRVHGRENDDERILAYNIGISIHDVNYATHIYQLFKENRKAFNELSDAIMNEPAEKFWL